MKRFIISVSLLVLFHVLVSCEAKHSNPLDPLNPDYNYGSIQGKVTNKAGEDLKDVMVTWKNQDLIAMTDTAGVYKIDGIQRKNGTIYFEKDGFKDSSKTISWGSQKNQTNINISLAFLVGQIEGEVYSSKGPLAGVKVTWVNQNIFSTTDSLGHFLISGVLRDQGLITFEKDGFSKTSISVTLSTWGNAQSIILGKQTMGYDIGVIDGNVVSNPHIPVEGARVIWKNQNIIAYTNSSGYYKLKGIKTEKGNLIFEKTGLRPDTLEVIWNDQDSLQLNTTMLYNVGSISGTVKGYPNDNVEGVKVTWKNLNISTFTNSDGYYKIKDLPMEMGIITFEKEELKTESRNVQWDNRLDSTNINITLDYTAGTLNGLVSESGSGDLLSSVQVLWKNTNQITYTINGTFSFSNIPYNAGMLYYQKDGYYKDSVFVQFTSPTNSVQSAQPKGMKFIPVLDSVNISTTVQFDFNAPSYNMNIFAQINDPSQQINLGQVYIQCPELILAPPNPKQLERGTGYYSLIYLSGQTNVSAWLGKDFIITAKDNTSKEFVIGKTKLTRVIDKEITVRSPKNSEVVSSQPTLNWDRFQPGFDFHYSIKIYDETSGTAILAWENENVSEDAISIVPEYVLSSGKYHWFITCIDQYGNKSISKKYKFEVQ